MRGITSKFILVMMLAYLCSAPAQAANMPDDVESISVVADPSVALPLTQIALEYTRQKHVSVAVSYRPFGQQEEEVTEGATYDVLITGRPKLLDSLKQRGMVDIYSEVAIASNRLVLISATGSSMQAFFNGSFPLVTLINYFQDQPRLIVGNPETMIEGTVARDAMRKSEVLQDLEPYTIYVKELSEIIQMVADEGYLAFVFESDAKQHPNIRIVDTLKADHYEPVTYNAVVLAGDKMDQARKFVDYLKQVRGQKIFESYYFQRP